MSTERTNSNKPLRPGIASNRAARTPLAPRIAAGATPTSLPKRSSSLRSDAQSEPPRPASRVKQHDQTPVKDVLGGGNITPRSSARKSKIDSASSTPLRPDSPNVARPRSTLATSRPIEERNGSVGGTGIANGAQSKAKASRPKSLVSDTGVSSRAQSPLVRSPGFIDLAPTSDDGIDSRFFHASDAPTIKPATKKPERKMAVGFFYADGQQEEGKSVSSRATSPVLSAVSEKRSSGPWVPNPSRSPPMLSPALSNLSDRSPFFAAATGQPKPRSPSPSKENIHLSYRKGASQIFGSRPSPIPTPRTSDSSASDAQPRRGSLELETNRTPHRKTTSLSSIDSGNSYQSRRRSATTLEPAPTPSPLVHEVKAATTPRVARSPTHLPSIDTSLEPSDSQMTLSPTKSISELAADARRERKVLDLEISNSSLLAINSSLEREVRRQKTELKRFRRLSRAGRLSYAPAARLSEGLSALGEEEVDDGFAAFGPPSGFTDVYDDFSDDETESITSGGEPLSPTSRSSKEHDRLLKDERRLQADMEKHKELLVQSQMMNQSLKRCTLATEDMIKEGKKALDHEIRISDVRLGGRILRGDDDEAEDVEVGDETLHSEDQVESAKGFLDVWQGVGSRGGHGSLGSSEGGDRDSGIEFDKPPLSHELPTLRSLAADSGRPPDEALLGAERPKLHWLHSIS